MEPVDFFAAHGGVIGGAILIALLFFYPRISIALMLICGKAASGGVIWWLAYLCTPYVLISHEAYVHYKDTNPLLVALSVLLAFFGTLSEWSNVNTRVKRAAKKG